MTYEKALSICEEVLAERVKRGDVFREPDQVVKDAAKAKQPNLEEPRG